MRLLPLRSASASLSPAASGCRVRNFTPLFLSRAVFHSLLVRYWWPPHIILISFHLFMLASRLAYSHYSPWAIFCCRRRHYRAGASWAANLPFPFRCYYCIFWWFRRWHNDADFNTRCMPPSAAPGIECSHKLRFLGLRALPAFHRSFWW